MDDFASFLSTPHTLEKSGKAYHDPVVFIALFSGKLVRTPYCLYYFALLIKSHYVCRDFLLDIIIFPVLKDNVELDLAPGDAGSQGENISIYPGP